MKKRLKHKVLLTIVAYLTINFFFSFLSVDLSSEAKAKGEALAKTGSQDKTKIHGERSRTIDSLETVLHSDPDSYRDYRNAKEDTTKIKALNAFASKICNNQTDKALIYANYALELSRKLDFARGMAVSYSNIAKVYWIQGNYPESLKNLHEKLKIHKELNDKKGISSSFGNIGILYINQGEYHKALEYYFKALKIDEELGDKHGIAVGLGNIGVAYKEQGDLSADSSARQASYTKAIEYYFKALKMAEELGDKRKIAINYIRIGVIYIENSENVKALDYCFKALKICEKLNDKSNVASTLGNIGSLYTKLKKYEESERYLLQALEIAKEIGYLVLIKEWNQALSELYEQTGQAAYAAGEMAASAARYKKAYEYHKEYTIAKDSLFNEEKSKDLGKLEAKHEMEMAEQKRKRKEEEQQRLETEQKARRNNLQYSGILIFLVLLIIAISFSGRLALPIRLAEGTVFFTFLLFFEFCLVYLDPYIDQWTGGEPAYKLAINAVLAGMIFPLHSFFEELLKKRTLKTRKRIK